MSFPHIDPIIFTLGPLAVRWYGMMYLLGFVGGYFIICHIVAKRHWSIDKKTVSDLLFYGVLGVVLGGRFGYTFFYNFPYYSQHPLEILYVWEGGMSFHGGLIGVATAMILFCYRRQLSFLQVTDLVVAAVPIGLGFGRIGNFINAELWGRTTDMPWGVIFPGAGTLPRHPSQIYQAGLEGVLLLVVIYLLHRRQVLVGVPSFCFLAFYGCFRFFVEFFRQPDSHLGFLWGGATMGQLLSVPMILVGVSGLVLVLRRGKS